MAFILKTIASTSGTRLGGGKTFGASDSWSYGNKVTQRNDMQTLLLGPETT